MKNKAKTPGPEDDKIYSWQIRMGLVFSKNIITKSSKEHQQAKK